MQDTRQHIGRRRVIPVRRQRNLQICPRSRIRNSHKRPRFSADSRPHRRHGAKCRIASRGTADTGSALSRSVASLARLRIGTPAGCHLEPRLVRTTPSPRASAQIIPVAPEPRQPARQQAKRPAKNSRSQIKIFIFHKKQRTYPHQPTKSRRTSW